MPYEVALNYAESYSWGRGTQDKSLAAVKRIVNFSIKDPDQHMSKQYWTMHLNASRR